MVCTTAYLIEEPTITEVTEHEVSVWDSNAKGYRRHYEPYLIPEYKVTFIIDYGPCCGVDFERQTFPTREGAQAAVDLVMNNQHSWIRYDPEYIEQDDD